MNKIKNLILIILPFIFLAGCSQEYFSATPKKYQSREDFLEYLMKGYAKNIPNLYLEDWKGKKSRLRALHQGLGLQEANTYYTMNRGELLIFERFESNLEPGELGTLVLSADSPPQMIRSPKELPFYKKRISLFSEKINDLDYWNPRRGGDDISGQGLRIVWDKDLRFVYYEQKHQGNPYDNNKPASNYIVSVDDPDKKVQSRLKRKPYDMVATKDRLYLAAQTRSKDLPVIHFEIFDIVGEDELRYVKDYYFDPPWAFAVTLCVFFDFDYQTNSQFINVWRYWPFPRVRYVYDYDDNSLKKAPYGTVKFINPAILKNSVKYIDLDKLCWK